MCRHNQLWGSILMAFGIGVLVGIWIGSGFFTHCFAIALMVCGFCVWRK